MRVFQISVQIVVESLQFGAVRLGSLCHLFKGLVVALDTVRDRAHLSLGRVDKECQHGGPDRGNRAEGDEDRTDVVRPAKLFPYKAKGYQAQGEQAEEGEPAFQAV